MDYDDPVDFKTRQFVGGVSLRTFWRPNRYSIFSISHAYNRFFTSVTDRRLAGVHTETGAFVDEKELRKSIYYTNQSVEQVSSIKQDWTWSLPHRNTLAFGTDVRFMQYNHEIVYHPIYDDLLDEYGQISDPVLINVDQKPIPKAGGYLNFKFNLGRRLTFNTGARYDSQKFWMKAMWPLEWA